VKAEGVAKAINESGGSAISVAGDILDANYLKRLVKEAAAFGNGKIHIIVNNAGYTWDGVIHKVDDNLPQYPHGILKMGRYLAKALRIILQRDY
jgi:NAD(P)-dependent dehydrogenase (short-subunit alcohol dehydrogenase family)